MAEVIPFDQVEDDTGGAALTPAVLRQNFIPLDAVENDLPDTPVSDDSLAEKLGKSAIKGTSQTLGSIADFQPASMIGRYLSGKVGDYLAGEDVNIPTATEAFEKPRQELIGDPVYETSGGRVLGTVAEYLPSALIPGGGGLTARIGAALSSGTGAGIAREIGAPEILGALAGPLGLAATTKLVTSAPGAIKDVIAPNTASRANEVVRGVVSKYTDLDKLGTKLNALQTTPKNVRVAEMVDDPGLALMTKVLEKSGPPEANLKGIAMDEARSAARLQEFMKAQGQAVDEPALGQMMQGALEEGKGTVKAATSKAYELAADGPGTIPLYRPKQVLADAISEETAKGIEIDPSIMGVVKTFMKTPAKLPVAKFDVQRQLIKEMTGDYRQMSNAGVKEKAALRVLGKLSSAMDEAEVAAVTSTPKVTKTGQVTGIPPQQAKALQDARALRAQQGITYEEGAVGGILDKNRFGRYETQPSEVLTKSIGSPEDVQQVVQGMLNAKKRGPEALQRFQAGVMERLRVGASNPTTGEFEPTRFANTWNKLKKSAGEALTPVQKKAVDNTLKDLISRKRFDDLASKASMKQSVTSQHEGAAAVVKDLIAEGVNSKLGFVSNFFGGIAQKRAAAIQSKVDEILVGLAFDPKFAKNFLKTKPSTFTVNSIAKEVLQRATMSIPTAVGSSRDPIDAAMDRAEDRINTDIAPQEDRVLTAADIQELGRSGPIEVQALFERAAVHAARALGVPESGLNEWVGNKLAGTKMSDILASAKAYAGQSIRPGDVPDMPVIPKSGSNSLANAVRTARAQTKEPAVMDALVKAVTHVESRGNKNAVSPKGATGLMQIMPATAREIADELGIKEYDLKDPDTNTRFGKYYLAKMMKLFDNDIELAAAAYNAGPGKVKKWVKAYGSNWDDIKTVLKQKGWYKETQDYVPRVVAQLNKLGSRA